MAAAELLYDRRAAEPLLAALEPGGPLHGLTRVVAQDAGLDLQLRAAHATLYAGRARVADLRLSRGDRLSLRLTAGEVLSADWPAVEHRLRAALDAGGRGDGALHAWLSRGEHADFVAVDRDARIAPGGRAEQAAVLAAARAPLAGLPAARRRSGDGIDALAIDGDGRVLVIAAGRGDWAPARLAVTVALARAWAEQDTVAAADVLEGQRDQRIRLGLLAPEARLLAITRPLEVVPAIALPGPPGPEAVAAMERVAAAVTAGGADLTGLRVLQPFTARG